MEEIVIREYKPGDPSLVCYLQMDLYKKQYGFKGIFEHYLLKAMSEFVKNPDGSQLWVAEKGVSIVGSIAIVKSGIDSAQVRWFAVSDVVQGKGIGSKLVDVAMQFCKDNGYCTISLWTIDILHSARHIYSKHGFVLTETKENTEWTGHTLLEEKWEYKSSI